MPDFDQHRFNELVLYVALQRAEDDRFGRTKLAKVLFYSDFEAYRDEGESLTGAKYIRMPFGPFPEPLPLAERQLSKSLRVRLDHLVGDYEEKRIVPLVRTADAPQYFEPWQLKLVEFWITDIAGATAKRASQLSHEHPGWLLAAKVGAEIPYASVFAPTQEPPDEAVELGRVLAREHEWP